LEALYVEDRRGKDMGMEFNDSLGVGKSKRVRYTGWSSGKGGITMGYD